MIYHPFGVLKLIWENISVSAFSRIVFIKTWCCQMMIYLNGEEVFRNGSFQASTTWKNYYSVLSRDEYELQMIDRQI